MKHKYRLLIEPDGWFISLHIGTGRGTWFCKNDVCQAPNIVRVWGVPQYIINEALKHIRSGISMATDEANEELHRTVTDKKRSFYRKPKSPFKKQYLRTSKPRSIPLEEYFLDFLEEYNLFNLFVEAKYFKKEQVWKLWLRQLPATNKQVVAGLLRELF